MVTLVGPTTASATEGPPGGGNITITGAVTNTNSSWSPGGLTVLSSPSFGTMTVTGDGEGGYTWVFVFSSDDPALDTLDSGDSVDVTLKVRSYDTSWGGNESSMTSGSKQLADTHQTTITVFGENEICFTRGTLIETPTGQCAIEDIQVGDLVVTYCHGPKPVKWIANSNISPSRRRGNSELEPILIEAGALALDLPVQDLAVSPQHRVLMTGEISDRFLDSQECLVAAKHLCNTERIRPCPERFEKLEYWHMLLDDHDVVIANGCPVETFFLGPMAHEILGPIEVEHIRSKLPDAIKRPQRLAFPVVPSREAKRLAAYLPIS